MQFTDGIVTIVQEGRFQMTDGRGVSHLFLLSHAAPLEPGQLAALAEEQARVRVGHTPSENVLARLACSVARLDR
jgi:hypothetical protein